MATVKRLVYHIPGDADYTLDLSRDLTTVCRKLHRQKQTYTILGGQLKESSGCVAYFKTAPHTWTTNTAIRRGFNIWRKANREVYQKFDIDSPKYSDFKVRLDSLHTSQRLLPAVLDATEQGGPGIVNYSYGEWNYSTLVQAKLLDLDGSGGLEYDDNADQWDMHIVGGHTGNNEITTDNGYKFYRDLTSAGLIRSWFDSRSVPDAFEPNNSPTGTGGDKPGLYTDPLSNVFDVQDDDAEMAQIIETENDGAPYDMLNVPGMNDGELQLVAFADNTAGEPDVVSIPGFQAPCGLVRITTEGNNGALLMLDVIAEGERI